MTLCTFVTNVYQRTYQPTLVPGRLEQMIAAHQMNFAERLLVINNVQDRAHATELAEDAVRRRALDRFVFVEDELSTALDRCGLRLQDLGRLRHYTDWALVELCAASTDYLLHEDAEVNLVRPGAWVAPALARMTAAPELLIANPSWTPVRERVLAESFLRDGPYAIGYGISDQIFLVRRTALAGPVYGHRHWASYRYPMAEMGPIFEAWVDTFMRRNQLLRLTDLRVVYQHTGEGTSHQTFGSLGQKARRRATPIIGRIGARLSKPGGQAAAAAYIERFAR
jgi:hypothetical protein